MNDISKNLVESEILEYKEANEWLGDGVGPSQHTEFHWNTPKLTPEIWPISPFLGVK